MLGVAVACVLNRSHNYTLLSQPSSVANEKV